MPGQARDEGVGEASQCTLQTRIAMEGACETSWVSGRSRTVRNSALSSGAQGPSGRIASSSVEAKQDEFYSTRGSQYRQISKGAVMARPRQSRCEAARWLTRRRKKILVKVGCGSTESCMNGWPCGRGEGMYVVGV